MKYQKSTYMSNTFLFCMILFEMNTQQMINKSDIEYESHEHDEY